MTAVEEFSRAIHDFIRYHGRKPIHIYAEPYKIAALMTEVGNEDGLDTFMGVKIIPSVYVKGVVAGD